MAKAIYIGVGGTARKVKNVYVGVGGVARRVKKAYIGVGGVARCFYSRDLAYYGTASALSVGRYRLAATSVGNYALFGGGYNNGTIYSTVDAYSSSLTRSTATALSLARSDLAATSVGSYALFGGGMDPYYNEGEDLAKTTVDAYNTSLTRSIPSALAYRAYYLAATSVGNYALFGGGQYAGTSFSYWAIVNAYNTSLTRTLPTELSAYCLMNAATTVGSYAIFSNRTTSVTVYAA